MVRLHIRRSTDSINVNIEGHEGNGCPLQTSSFTTTVKECGRRQLGRYSVCPAARDRRTDCSEWVCKNHTVYTAQIKCGNCRNNQTNFIHISVLNYSFLSSKSFMYSTLYRCIRGEKLQ
jgi:hypothetical protein